MAKDPQSGARETSALRTGTSEGHGEMAALMRTCDWSQTPLGPVETWPQSLKTAVNILLTSRFAMWLGWGPELAFLYNDAYRPTLGLKHPWALGTPFQSVWAEVWENVRSRVETVLSTGEATFDQDLLLFLQRSGFPEETYHTFSYSPLADDAGHVSGLLCVVSEETDRVINERRMATLRDLSSAIAAANTEPELMSAVGQELGANQKDLPFSLVYLFDRDGDAVSVKVPGLLSEHPAAPERIAVGQDGPWPAAEVYAHGEIRIVSDLAREEVGELPHGAWDRAPVKAAVVPIRQQAQDKPAGFLVAGLNPYRGYDESYSGFIELVAGQIAAGLSNARAYEEERRRAEALAELDRAKTAFFSNVSHEFRTPLTLMLGPVEDMLSHDGESDSNANSDMLAVVHRNGLRLQRLVNTLLDFSRIEAGRTQASFEPTDLCELTVELASSFRSAMDRAGLQYSVNCEQLSQPVFVDREMWEKIVLNLVSNAFKYTHEGDVTVRLQERNGRAALTVIDTGVGIPAEQLPHVFERFHRVEGARGRTNEGTGIGLALVQELVSLHGGQVHVTSQVDAGSTFEVEVPLGSKHLPQERVGATRGLTSTALHADSYVEEALRWLPGGGEEAPPDAAFVNGNESDAMRTVSLDADSDRSSVLLADDNADMREYVTRLLSSRYHVRAVANGEQARQSAIADPPDLVLTDVMMPVLDGFGLLKALRSNESTRTLPIILLSARAGEESRIEGLDAGADDYLVKPFTARELLARVEAHISLARMRREADEEIRQKNEELIKANRELEEFAYVASHDLQEPLRMVNIYTQLLVRMSDGLQQKPEAREYASFISRGVHRMEDLIKDLLVYSRVVHHDEEGAPTADLNRALNEALTVLLAVIEESGATVESGPLPTVAGDERQYALVFQNLISNAIKYRRKGVAPLVRLSAEQVDSEWRIYVDDNGIGFDPRQSERIFGLFKRLHKEAYPGTGLGLAICKRIVERYHGRIWAESEGEEHGSRFTFALEEGTT